jgi:peptidoglycan DL-endopeptidase CwlO
MARSAGVSGLAVGLIAAGGLLVYSGIRGVSVTDALRSALTTGTLPAGQTGPSGGSSAAGSTPGATPSAYTLGASNNAIAADALKYEGKVGYRWGGADPSGWDCSGFVTWVLHHDLGYSLPSNVHTVCTQFYAWSGAYKVSADQVQAGDLVVWPSHMGIAVSPTQMISAENPTRGTKVDTFQGGGPIPYSTPTFLRVKTAAVTA